SQCEAKSSKEMQSSSLFVEIRTYTYSPSGLLAATALRYSSLNVLESDADSPVVPKINGVAPLAYKYENIRATASRSKLKYCFSGATTGTIVSFFVLISFILIGSIKY